ncbi:type IV secretion system protein VirB1 2 (plasmid) [Rhizobium sp. N6212]|nr:type IV secretion system protein VirB1 2 [Rhizobium sp. N6212]ANL01598.1 type IV secretion system protein VirB1 2 [Rhizobium sp. N621]ANL07726.1 type IV secretion system protein VirB1 2 [Rhizobium esperanzae]ANL13897.1 type IV secretion system protein VirB1 2 [Rhizobium sp. N1341]ANL25881.1 type IV secretion system protein VirB1 2 [Rhizobium sp. N113]ANM38567.1 type IV secretion system protein VirB1 2 [Rhizobium sp. N871]ANM44722.1 type IV secretion system protein VirB1 2 [Rhizobium sp. N7
MADAFVDIAQACAPMVKIETLAAVVSLESGFQPLAIRVNSGPPLAAQPHSKAEAIEVATSLMADRKDIQIGLGGLGIEALQKLDLSVADAFDPCLNLKATATLLDGYYRVALRAGDDPALAVKVMLQSYYGRDDPSVGAMVKYDEQVRQEIKRLSPMSLTLAKPGDQVVSGERSQDEVGQAPPGQSFKASQTAGTASWDVFNSRRQSSVLVFQK